MANGIKNGRRPVSQKSTSAPLNADDVFTNPLSIPEDIQKDADAKGIELRWVDAKQVFENAGQHVRDWVPYRRAIPPPSELQGFKLGNDPEGIVRRKSLVLAYKTKEQAEKHRTWLRQRAEQQKIFNKQEADRLRAEAKRANINVAVTEGYEDEDN